MQCNLLLVWAGGSYRPTWWCHPATSAPPCPPAEHSLAQAVLSGLPADDEAVAVARMAAAAGRSIQEVAAMSRGEDYGATAYRVALRGRIQAGGAEVRGWLSCRSVVRQAMHRQGREASGGLFRCLTTCTSHAPCCFCPPRCPPPIALPPSLSVLQESLYAEAASWTDPATLEKQLQRAAERRKRPLTGQELRAVKQRKAEMKEKKKVGWLFT